jgi:hypothetical protein
MPFRLTNAPATCQALINNVLQEYLDIFVVAYLDNILIFSRNKVEHIDHIKLVLQALDQAELRLKPKKCKFHKEEVKFLGFTVSIHRVKISKSKIKVVKD